MERTLQVRKIKGLACSPQRNKGWKGIDMIPTYKYMGVGGCRTGRKNKNSYKVIMDMFRLKKSQN